MLTVNSGRVLKNTAILYLRMIFVMGVSLFTARIVLSALGLEDYGLYNLVAGIITLFAFMSNSMMAATQRFFSFELGVGNLDKLKRTFSSSLWIYLLLSFIVVVLGETVGIWFINNKLVISPLRLEAAIIVFHFSIFSFVVSIMTIPFTALIVAHERMEVFAFIGIIEVLARLFIAYYIVSTSYDRLMVYSVLMCSVVVLVFMLYVVYSFIKYKEARWMIVYESGIFKKMLGFTGWNLFGSLAGVVNNQGASVLLNMFFGLAVNGARAISLQISTAVNQFVANFMTATRPQITKLYANQEYESMLNLVFSSSKMSFFLLMIVASPLLLESDFVITIWLGETPEFVTIFTQLLILTALIDSLSYPLMTMAQATGNIKTYQVSMAILLFLCIPISYFLVKNGAPAYSILVVSLIISLIALFVRLFILKKMVVQLNIALFLKEVVLKCFIVMIITFIPAYFCFSFLSFGMFRFIIVSSCLVIFGIVSIYFFGLSPEEKKVVNSFKNKFLRKI